MESKFEEPIKVLKKLAHNSIVRYKHAAGLMSGNIMYSAAINKFSRQVKTKENDVYYKTIHAELNVFEKLSKKKIKGMDILVIRINNNFALRNSRPCNQCIEKLRKIGIRKVFYSTDDGTIVSEFIEHMDKIHTSAGNFLLSSSCS